MRSGNVAGWDRGLSSSAPDGGIRIDRAAEQPFARLLQLQDGDVLKKINQRTLGQRPTSRSFFSISDEAQAPAFPSPSPGDVVDDPALGRDDELGSLAAFDDFAPFSQNGLPQANICPTKTEAIDAALKDAERYDVKPCFPIGTSVVNCHGGLSDIDQIGVGGWVLSRNEKTGEQAYRRITRKFEHYKENRPDAPDFPLYGICYIAETGEAGGVSATPEHPFWVNGLGWVPASKLKPGQKLEICDPVALNDDYRPEGLKTEDFTLDGENWQAVVVSIEDARDDFGYRLKYLTGTGESFSKYLKADHPFLVEGLGWVQASELKPGQILKNSKSAGEPGGPSRSGKRWQATITLVEKRSRGTGVVYNIEVEEFHTYFVGHHGIWVHNECQGTHGCN